MAARLIRAGTAQSRRRRRAAAALLVAAVALWHAWVATRLADAMLGDGSASQPPPIEVSFVRELAPSAPPPAPPAPPPRRAKAPARAVAPAPAPAASEPAAQPEPGQAPESGEALADADAPATEAAPAEVVDATGVADATGATPAADDSQVAAEPDVGAFEWPPSTRLSYHLNGWYLGEVTGSARVQWLRSGDHYQVHLDVVIGPTFSPLVARRMLSDGELTADGLRPRRYDEETLVPLRPVRRTTTHFGRDQVQLPNGRSIAAVAGLQDPASQFVQLTWLFTLQPHLLSAGEAVELPIALPRRIEVIRYEVIGEDLVATPMGELPAWHVRPRRTGDRQSKLDLSAEAWFAPSLQYLPVRIRISEGSENYIELTVSGRPLQAE
jgi:hypothetical protein